MKPEQPNIFLSIGSNQGDRVQSLVSAIAQLEESGVRTSSFSSIYETQPWGFSSDSLFLNMVIEVRTTLKATELLEKCLAVEAKMGRVRLKKGYASRTIDIDILFYGEQIVNNPGLIIPHPLIQIRRFVLQPLCEIAPEFQHPLIGKAMKEMLDVCPDPLEVKIFKTRNEVSEFLPGRD